MASQAVYVDLDLKGNAINNVALAVDDTDVPNWGQVEAAITESITTASHPEVTGAGAIAVDAAQVVSLTLASPELGQTADGLTVDLGGVVADADLDAALADYVLTVTAGTGLVVDNADPQNPVVGVDPDSLTAVTDAINTKANKTTAANAGAGLTGSGTLGADFTFDVVATDTSIAVADDGISVAPSGITSDKLATGAVGNLQLGANLYGLIDVERLSTDPASALLNNVLTFNGTQWVGQAIPAVSVPVTSVAGTLNEIDVANTGGAHVVSLAAAVKTDISDNAAAIAAETVAREDADEALQGEVDTVESGLETEITNRANADTALGARIDNLAISGSGMATVTESEENSGIWTVNVPALQLSNTYSGETGIDTGTINTDILPALAEPGDLYINTGTGQAFIYDGTNWVELAAAEAGLKSIASGDASITVTNGGGPAVDVKVSASLQSAIATATAINLSQDTSIGILQGQINDLDGESHAAVTSGNGAIGVSGQAVSLVTNSPELSVDATGLKINLASYATDIELGGAVTALEGADAAIQDALDEEIARSTGADSSHEARLDDLDASQGVQDGKIAALETSQGTQDGKILALEAKHPAPQTLTFTGEGPYTATATGPVGGVASVRVNGCLATFSVCESGTTAGEYTVTSNVSLGTDVVTLHFG